MITWATWRVKSGLGFKLPFESRLAAIHWLRKHGKLPYASLQTGSGKKIPITRQRRDTMDHRSYTLARKGPYV